MFKKIFKSFLKGFPEIAVGAHCGVCGKWVEKAITSKDWQWTICKDCKDKKVEEKQPCCLCAFAQMGIPCGYCTHPEGEYQDLPDRYWFNNRPNDCPKKNNKKVA